MTLHLDNRPRAGSGSSTTPPAQRPGTRLHWWGVVVVILLGLAVRPGTEIIGLQLVAGLLLVIVLPTAIVANKVRWRVEGSVERWLYAFACTLLGVISLSLACNTVLPWVGVDHPLSAGVLVPLAVSTNVGLLLWRSADNPRGLYLSEAIDTVTVVACLAVLTAVGGAIRLNNGAGSGLAVWGLVLSLGVITALFARRHATVTNDSRAIYLLSLALLLGSSLRSWFISGHDIQREYLVFQATYETLRWHPGAFQDAYNACLSITVLPTVIAVFTGVDGPYVYKAIFQFLFAVVPVAVYVASRRFLHRRAALLGVVFLISFPTFIIDMPMLNRQEIAFIFLSVMMLAATQPRWSVRARKIAVYLGGLGIVVTHYSTTYILILGIVLGLACWGVAAGLARFRRGGTRRTSSALQPDLSASPVDGTRIILSVGLVATLLGACWLWSGPVTNTGGFLRATLSDVVAEVRGDVDNTGSSDAEYSLLAAQTLTPQERLDAFGETARDASMDARAAGSLVPLTPDADDLRVVTPQVQDLTAAGETVAQMGISPETFNAQLRIWSARLLQIFLLVGVCAVLLRTQRARSATPELRFLAVGTVGAMAAITLIPGLSVAYGLLRIFQQSLIILAPIMGLGVLTLLVVLGRAARPTATAIALVMFASLSGLLPQVLGGYEAQTNTSNGGDYFDRYYVTQGEPAALDWLIRSDARITDDIPLVSDAYTLGRLSAFGIASVPARDDFHPELLTKESFVLVGTPTVTKEQSTISYAGDQVTYNFPMDMLEDGKDRLYDSGVVRVYR